jgi:hypothetical protein
VTEDGGADRPGDEGGRERRQRGDRCEGVAEVREKHGGEHQRCGVAIDEEVVVLDRRADEAGEGDPCHWGGLAQMRTRRVFGRQGRPHLPSCIELVCHGCLFGVEENDF